MIFLKVSEVLSYEVIGKQKLLLFIVDIRRLWHTQQCGRVSTKKTITLFFELSLHIAYSRGRNNHFQHLRSTSLAIWISW